MSNTDKLREMNSTEALREIAVKWCPWSEKTSFKRNGKDYVPFDQMVSDLTALISEHCYPKEFLLWTHSQDYWLFDSLTCLWVSDEPKAFQEEKTTDELFEYWKENEQ